MLKHNTHNNTSTTRIPIRRETTTTTATPDASMLRQQQKPRVFIVLLLSFMNLFLLLCCCCLLLLPPEYTNTLKQQLSNAIIVHGPWVSVLPTTMTTTRNSNNRRNMNYYYHHHHHISASIDNNINDFNDTLVTSAETTTTKATTNESEVVGAAVQIALSDAIHLVQEHGYYVCWTTTTTSTDGVIDIIKSLTTTNIESDRSNNNNNIESIRTMNNKKYDFVYYNDVKEPVYCSVSNKDRQQQKQQQQDTIHTPSSLDYVLNDVSETPTQQQKQQQRRALLRSSNYPTSSRILLLDNNNDNNTETTTDTDTTTSDIGDNNANVVEEEIIENWWIILINSIGVLCCVVIAAIAAGLTVGMLGLDPLMLLIKERASTDPAERIMAQQLLPIIRQRHLLLVTLLIMNSIANEALPIFLEKVVPSAVVAIIISVTLVLFFGEIIPSAIFTGPNQLQLASYMIPIVKFVMFILYPIAKPIATLLDIILSGGSGGGSSKKLNTNGTTEDFDNSISSDIGGNGGHSHDEGFSMYDRHELAALIRIQYEERLANKRRSRIERTNVHAPYHTLSTRNLIPDAAAIHHSVRNNIESLPQIPTSKLAATSNPVVSSGFATPTTSVLEHDNNVVISPTVTKNVIEKDIFHPSEWSNIHQNISASIEQNRSTRRDSSIELDEVMMVEGALQMKTKCAFDVFTPIRHVYALPASMILTEKNMVAIYASGYSRIPVYDDTIDTSSTTATSKKRKYPQSAIIGILVTKVLIVVDPKDQRTVGSLPLRIPQCVSPGTSLVDLINMFQTGGPKGGHQALVCTSPSIGNRALAKPGQCLPEKAGLIGIVTFEDVLEMLLQEEIYDEMDKEQRAGQRLAEMVYRRWKVYTERKKITDVNNQSPAATTSGGNTIVNETTALLRGSTTKY